MKTISKSELDIILSQIEHPEIANTLSELGMIGDSEINTDEKLIKITLVLPMQTIPIEIRDMIINTIASTLKKEVSGYKLRISMAVMTEVQKTNFFSLSKQNWKL